MMDDTVASDSAATVTASSTVENGSLVTPLGERRVRPEELVAALNRIEKRRGAALAGTVTLDDALRELQVDATAAEVWQEIEAGRLRSQTAATEKQVNRQQLYRKAAVVVACLLVTSLALR